MRTHKQYTISQLGPSGKDALPHQTELNVFKTRIRDLMQPGHDDMYLMKWLKARSYDVDKAEQMFRASMAYRKKMKTDTLLMEYEPPEVLRKYFPGGFYGGVDNEGSPILIELYGYLDMKGLMHSAKKIDMEKSKLLLGEQITHMLKGKNDKLGNPIDGITVIIDMENVDSSILWGPGLQMYTHMGSVLQDNYPEVVKRSFIVNAPRIFPVIWKIVQPLLTEDMKRKVCILGGDYQKELLKHIDKTQLPAFLGGTMTDNDGNPRCPSRIVQGGKVPEKYYLKELINTSFMTKTLIPAGEKLRLKNTVSKPGSVLKWEFISDDYDLGFGITFDNGHTKEELIQTERVNSHMVPEDGAITCKDKGTYIIHFDNTYSWTRGKYVYYNIEIMETDSDIMADLNRFTQGGNWDKVDVAPETEVTSL